MCSLSGLIGDIFWYARKSKENFDIIREDVMMTIGKGLCKGPIEDGDRAVYHGKVRGGTSILNNISSKVRIICYYKVISE